MHGEADKWLVSLSYNGIALSLENLEKAILIAEEHMQSSDKGPSKVKSSKVDSESDSLAQAEATAETKLLSPPDIMKELDRISTLVTQVPQATCKCLRDQHDLTQLASSA